MSGSPVCLDVAKTNGSANLACDTESHRDLVAVGYQDNSFVVYSILQGFRPLYRGCEHRSFVCQVKFDNFFMQKQMQERNGHDPIEEQKLAAQEMKANAKAAFSNLGASAEESKTPDAKISTNRLTRAGSKNRLVELLRRNTTRTISSGGFN